MAKYSQLAITDPDDLLFGVAPRPLQTRQGLRIGGGTVYPELNFTLPPMLIENIDHPKHLCAVQADHRRCYAPGR